MLLFRTKLFSLRTRLLAAFLIAFASIFATLFTVHQAMAETTIMFSVINAGESPDSYGADASNGEWRYVYEFEVYTDYEFTSIEYEIDGNGRQSLENDIISGGLGYSYAGVRFLLDQTTYADFEPHTITFYANDTTAEEASTQFSLEPYPDPSSPIIYFSEYTEGQIESTMAPYYFEVTDDYIDEVVVDIDGEEWEVSPYNDYFDYKEYQLNLSSGYTGTVDLFDGNEHTFRVTATDPYGNSAEQSYTYYFDDSGGEEFDSPEFYFYDAPEGNQELPLYYSGTVSDASEVDQVYYQVDGGGYNWVNITYDTPEYKEFDIEIDGLSDGPHTIEFLAYDVHWNSVEASFDVTIGEVEEDTTPPVFVFDEAPSGNQALPLLYSGTVTDSQSEVDQVYYRVDDGGYAWVTIDNDNSTLLSKVFSVELSELSTGEHTIDFLAYDAQWNSVEESFTVNIDSTDPTCPNFYNLPSPHYSEVLNYENITCTDNVQITNASYEIYHVVQGTLQAYADHPVLPEDGVFDEASETFDFTVDLTEFGDIDGVILVNFRAGDAAGNYSSDYDPVTIDATDNTAPTVHIDEVTPDPLTDTTPTITGSCRDDRERETNSFISNLEYRIDAGSYQAITLANGGVYNDSYTESYSVDLPELSNGSHTVTVRCTDGASRTSTVSDTFTIQDPEDAVPGEFVFTENFESIDNQDIPASSNIVWGDGKLRLKEDITITRNLIANTDLCAKYATCYGEWRPWKDPVDPNLIWYSMNGKIFTYNTQTQVNAEFTYQTTYSLPALSSHLLGFDLGVYNGKKYLFMSDLYSLYVINLTDGVAIHDPDYENIGSINLDFARNRFAAYVTTDAPGGSSNVAYMNLNDMMDTGDDTFTRIPYARFNSDSVVGLFTDPDSNAVFVGPYAQPRLYKFNDQNTPEDTGDDVVTSYESGTYDTVFGGMTIDPEGRLIFGTANNSNGRLFVVEDDGGTPFDASDDNVVQLASPLPIGYRNIYGLEYIVGQNGVGDQLLINTEANIPVYLNFNNTYTNPYDDTFIDLDTQAGVRPGGSWAVMDGYNTMYVVSRTQGFYKVDLNRGWKDMGEAVAIPTRPPQQLVVDNFVAEASVAGPIAYAPGSDATFLSQLGGMIVPQAYAAPGDGIRYYVSTDGGVTWTEVTLGQLQQLQQTDYRVKFKIEMEEVDGATPVLSSYSLAYAGYPDEETPVTTTGLEVSPSTTSTTDGGSFNLTVEAVDVLGYPTPSYNGSVTLSLIDTSTNSVTTGLSVSSINLTAGAGTLSGVQINKVGSFKIRATDGNFTQDSATITVTSGASIPSPYLGFSASSFKVKKGESVTLHWASSNLTSFVLNPGNNQLSAPTGDFIVHPDQTTEYTITGTGPYGSAVASLTVTVEGEISNPGVSPSPTPSTTATPTPTPTTVSSGSPADGRVTTIEGDVIAPEEATFDSTFSEDQTIVRGQKATISWDIPGADEVTVDYPDVRTVSSKGSFDFFPTDTIVVTITARKGDEVIQKRITITVLDAPVQLQEFARNIQEQLPWTTPLLSGVIQAAKALPFVGLAVSAAIQAGVVGLLLLTVISQAGFLTVLNVKTLTNILSAAGLLPAKNRKGFMHQTRNGVPVPFATVTVFEGLKKSGNAFVTLVSDMYGVYLDPYLPKGDYNFYAAHDSHNFPTKAERPSHLSFKDFYRGEVIHVASSKDRPAVLIPMDPKSPSQMKNIWRYKLLLLLNQTLQTFQWLVYPLAILSVIALWLSPSILNGLIVLFYAVILIPKLLALFKKPTLSGRVITDGDRRPVANATITLTTNDGSVVAVSKSDDRGQFEIYSPQGDYVLNVISSNMIWNDNKAGTLNTVKTGTPKSKNMTLTMSKITNPFGGF